MSKQVNLSFTDTAAELNTFLGALHEGAHFKKEYKQFLSSGFRSDKFIDRLKRQFPSQAH